MSTSANVSEFRIEKDGKQVGSHRQNWLCKTRWEELLKYQPLEEHTITETWYDEEEEYDEGKPQNLKEFLIKNKVKIE